MNGEIVWISAITTSEENLPIRVSGNVRINPHSEMGEACYHLYSNPLMSDFRSLLLETLSNENAHLTPTVVISKDILDDSEILNALREKAGEYTSIRIADEGYTLTREDYDKLSFASMIFVDSCEEELQHEDSIVVQNNVFKFEMQIAQPVLERRNSFDETVGRIAFHINHKLSEEEFEILAESLNICDNASIELDYFDPSYYEEFLEGLQRHNVRSDINIQLIGYLLEDQLDVYEKLSRFPYEIDVVYSTCHDMVDLYTREPYTQNRLYYSQIEGGGKTSLQNYLNVLKELTDFETEVKRGNLSPLEIAVYAKMKIDEEYIYDPDADFVDEWDNINLSQMINHEVDGKKRAVCMGFTTLYSALLRRSNVPMFRYSTTGHSRSIGRIADEKYGVDSVCVSELTWDLYSTNNNLPCYNRFMVAPRDFLKILHSECATIADVLSLPMDEYIRTAGDAVDLVESFYNPFYEPGGYTTRMLELMGLVQRDGLGIDLYDNVYRLCEEGFLEGIPQDTILQAIDNVLAFRGKTQEEIDLYHQTVEDRLQDRAEIFCYSPALLNTYNSDFISVEALTMENVETHRANLDDNRLVYYRTYRGEEPQEEFVTPSLEEDTLEEDVHQVNDEEDIHQITDEEDIHQVNDDASDMLNDLNTIPRGTERVYLYHDVVNNEFYVIKAALSRFDINPTSEEVRINNRYCFRISLEDADYIINHQDNGYSPYVVELQEVDEVEEIDNESVAKENYVMQLLQYVEENNISIFHYYVDLGNHYRQDPNYQPQGFEQNNPFITENDINLLRQSNEEYIQLYFADCLSKVVELNRPQHILANQEELFVSTDEEFKEEVRHR